jgi:hypothetical protein
MLSVESAPAAREQEAASFPGQASEIGFLPRTAGEASPRRGDGGGADGEGSTPEDEDSRALWRRTQAGVAHLVLAKLGRLAEEETAVKRRAKRPEELPQQAQEAKTLCALLLAGERLARLERMRPRSAPREMQDGGPKPASPAQASGFVHNSSEPGGNGGPDRFTGEDALPLWRAADLALARLTTERIERHLVDDGFNILEGQREEAQILASLALAAQRLARIEAALTKARGKAQKALAVEPDFARNSSGHGANGRERNGSRGASAPPPQSGGGRGRRRAGAPELVSPAASLPMGDGNPQRGEAVPSQNAPRFARNPSGYGANGRI